MAAIAQTAIVIGGVLLLFVVGLAALLISDGKWAIPGTSHSRLIAAQNAVQIADLKFKTAQIELNAFEMEQRRYDLALGQGERT